MTSTGIATMVAVMAFVWGGFVFLFLTAIRKESRKRERASDGSA